MARHSSMRAGAAPVIPIKSSSGSETYFSAKRAVSCSWSKISTDGSKKTYVTIVVRSSRDDGTRLRAFRRGRVNSICSSSGSSLSLIRRARSAARSIASSDSPSGSRWTTWVCVMTGASKSLARRISVAIDSASFGTSPRSEVSSPESWRLGRYTTTATAATTQARTIGQRSRTISSAATRDRAFIRAPSALSRSDGRRRRYMRRKGSVVPSATARPRIQASVAAESWASSPVVRASSAVTRTRSARRSTSSAVWLDGGPGSPVRNGSEPSAFIASPVSCRPAAARSSASLVSSSPCPAETTARPPSSSCLIEL